VNLLEEFGRTGALLKGHFLLSSGLHSDQYMQCALLLSHPRLAERLGADLASLVKDKPDLVLSPAMGGVVIGQEVARALGVRHVFAERENGVMTLRRGFALSKGERAVLVEDVITTGKSSGEVIALAAAKGAKVISALSIVCRAAEPPELGVPVKSLLNLTIASWPAASCPLCKQGTPAVKPGSRPSP
jgi:orotate phosphoribosyltransferase